MAHGAVRPRPQLEFQRLPKPERVKLIERVHRNFLRWPTFPYAMMHAKATDNRTIRLRRFPFGRVETWAIELWEPA